MLIEHRDEEIEEASLEVLAEARRLAKKAKLRVSALVPELERRPLQIFGPVRELANDLIKHIGSSLPRPLPKKRFDLESGLTAE